MLINFRSDFQSLERNPLKTSKISIPPLKCQSNMLVKLRIPTKVNPDDLLNDLRLLH